MPFIVTPFINNQKNRLYLDRLKGIDLEELGTFIKGHRYITSNRGNCVHFTALLMTASLSYADTAEKFRDESAQALPHWIDLVWNASGTSSVVVIPFGLTPQKLSLPINRSLYGNGDLATGINFLLEEGSSLAADDKDLMVLFAAFQEENTFDYRCY